MLKLCVIVAVVFCVSADWYEESSLRFTGKRSNPNTYFKGWTFEQVKNIMGTRLDKKPGQVHPVKSYDGVDLTQLPVNFTSADKWPKCGLELNYIKDQAACGSCWAVAASEVIADRTCIANIAAVPNPSVNTANGREGLVESAPMIDMSAEQILSCCYYCGDGCQGGYPIDAMKYWKTTGVVTGGWYGSNCGCYPYEVPPCPDGCEEGPTPACKQTCRSGYSKTLSQDKHFATDYYEISNDVSSLMMEIYNHGPIECAFTVYENFMHYPHSQGVTNTVYNKVVGRNVGGHAITVVGWGQTSDGIPYWEIRNSWNTTWGLEGTFRFLRGSDLCGMESQCVAGMAKTSDKNFLLQC